MAQISTLVDSFSAATINSTQWSTYNATLANQKVSLPATTSGASLTSKIYYDLTNSSFFANVVPPSDVGGYIQTYMTIATTNETNKVYIYSQAGYLYGQVSGQTAVTLSNDPNNRWWLIRHSAGRIYFDLSTDGINWSNAGSSPITWDVSSLYPYFYVYNGATITPTPVTTVDNVNFVPAAGSPTVNNSPTKQTGFVGDTTKTYLYKVYNQAMQFIGIWKDVSSEPQFTQAINTQSTSMVVKLARSPDETQEVRDSLVTQSGETITTQTGEQLVVKYQQSNVVGGGSDAELAYYVDVYVTYGGYDTLVTQAGEPMTTQDGEQLLVAVGAPLGRRIFSGFILDYTSDYGGTTNNSNVSITLVSNGYELNHEVIRDNGAYTGTTKSFDATGESVVSAIVNTNPGRMTTVNSLVASGINVKPTFQLNTKAEGIQTVVDQMGSNYYWYGNPADNNVYLGLTKSTPDHTFVQGKHLNSVKVKRTLEGMVNDFYFVGGTPAGGTQVYKHYIDPGNSLTTWRRSLLRKTDQRYLLATSMQNVATGIFNKNAQPLYSTTIAISSATYDIETIQLGQIIAFRNFGNFVDTLLLQVVNRSYTPYMITLTLGTPLMSSNDIVTDVEQQANATAFQTLPISPS